MTGADPADRRLLLVHAHPDDESIGTGATMAHYVAAGAQVSLITCTLGEEGEILLPALAQLAAGQADQLGGWRIAELSAAMAQLGVTDHRFLGGAGRFRDSGMMGDPANQRPRAFWRAAADPAVFQAAVSALVEVVRELRPQVVVTYDEAGGYGHPDHIMANRVTTAAIAAAADPQFAATGQPWSVPKLYWTAMPRSAMQASLDAIAAAGRGCPFATYDSLDQAPVVADELVTTVIMAEDQVPAKAAALAAHRTQVSVAGRFYALSNNLGQLISGVEYFRLVAGQPGGPLDDRGRETDLFGGLTDTADTVAAGAVAGVAGAEPAR